MRLCGGLCEEVVSGVFVGGNLSESEGCVTAVSRP